MRGPTHRGERVGALADALRIASFRCADSAKVEAQDVRAELRERARDGRHDLVLHRALLERMRVADDGERARRRVDRVDRRLERPAGPGTTTASVFTTRRIALNRCQA